MSFFRRLKGKASPEAAPPEFTFAQRVEAFWEWYAGVAERFHRTMEDHRCGDLSEEVSRKVNELLPGMAWVFGPGEKPGEHSFTLSGEGIEFKQVLAYHWLQRAPRIGGWCFYAERMPSDDPGHFSLQFDELVFKVMEFWVTPEVDEENERVDLTVWHPLAEQIEVRHCQTALFLVLDEIFGEMGTGRWIGSMEFSRKKLGESMPILELKEFVDATRSDRGWKFLHPCNTWTNYEIPPQKRSNKPRFDTIGGCSMCWRTFRDYLRDPEAFTDPFRELHAEWIYLSFPCSVLPEGRQVDAREDMADLITSALGQDRSGIPLGGAIGERLAYMDFLIFDGERSIARIREAARKAGMPADTRLEFLDSRRPGMPLFQGVAG